MAVRDVMAMSLQSLMRLNTELGQEDAVSMSTAKLARLQEQVSPSVQKELLQEVAFDFQKISRTVPQLWSADPPTKTRRRLTLQRPWRLD